jgi:HEAT repeat protein
VSQPVKRIKITYPSPERFWEQYKRSIIHRGLFIPSGSPLPKATPVELVISIPKLETPFVVEGTVVLLVAGDAKDDVKKQGMTIRFDTGEDWKLAELERRLKRSDVYGKLFAEKDTSPKTAVTSGGPGGGADSGYDTKEPSPGAAGEKATPAPLTHGVPVKTELEVGERKRMEKAAVFVLDLVKAMLRSGYYAPEHPGSKRAKEGVYNEFREVLGDRSDITLASQEKKGRFDVMISGILDDYVSLREVVGIEQARIFIPKFREYFQRKNLVSFSLKRELSLNHFDDFIDIMSDPARDEGAGGEIGSVLTGALVDKGITEVSTIFMDDMIILELKLPWRVEMAIQRLAKDLKVLPMFKDKSEEEIQAIKIRIVQDIIRPLKEPQFLKDIVVNCHVIARHVTVIDAEELEQTIVKSFPMEILLPTSQYVFDELTRIRKELEGNPDHAVLKNRMESVKRTLRWISHRVADEKIEVDRKFFEELYFQGIVSFDELPESAKHHVSTLKLAKEVREHPSFYIGKLDKARSEKDLLLLLKLFRRILPALLEQGAYDLVSVITRALQQKFAHVRYIPEKSPKPFRDPVRFVWQDSMELLARRFEEEQDEARASIERIVEILGPFGVSLLVRVLMQSQSKAIRKLAMDTLIQMGDSALEAMKAILANPSHPWYLFRNSLIIVSRLGREGDASVVNSFLRHADPRVRDEALKAVSRLEGVRAEPKLIRALQDPDRRVIRSAVFCMGQLPLKTNRAITSLLGILRMKQGRGKEGKKAVTELKVQTIHALSEIGNEPVDSEKRVEDVLLMLVKAPTGLSDGFFSRITVTSGRSDEDYAIQSAALEALWKIGSRRILPDLEKLAKKGDRVLGNRIKETIRQIRHREERRA